LQVDGVVKSSRQIEQAHHQQESTIEEIATHHDCLAAGFREGGTPFVSLWRQFNLNAPCLPRLTQLMLFQSRGEFNLGLLGLGLRMKNNPGSTRESKRCGYPRSRAIDATFRRRRRRWRARRDCLPLAFLVVLGVLNNVNPHSRPEAK